MPTVEIACPANEEQLREERRMLVVSKHKGYGLTTFAPQLLRVESRLSTRRIASVQQRSLHAARVSDVVGNYIAYVESGWSRTT